MVLNHGVNSSQQFSWLCIWLLGILGKWVLWYHVSLFHRLGNEIPIRLKIDGLKTIWGFLTPQFIFSRMNSREQSQTLFLSQRNCHLLVYLQHLQQSDTHDLRQIRLILIVVLSLCHLHITADKRTTCRHVPCRSFHCDTQFYFICFIH